VAFSYGPFLGENIFAIRRVAVNKGDNYAWAEWTPEHQGNHRLYFHVLTSNPEVHGTPGDTLDVTASNGGWVADEGGGGGGCFLHHLP
jgi:hypothetical protein